ncbi:MAG: 16S rRNA processing protein RimM [bacterium]|nr:16S rRNA processing protein RimM [bacterium]
MTMARKTPSNEHPIGRIAGLFGLRGELKCDPTSAGRAVFLRGAELRLELDGRSERVRIASVREHGGRLLVALDGVPDATAAQRYVGGEFFAPREALDVADDEYLDVDLIGCAVVATDGHSYGDVQRVEHYPASDMLIVGGRMLPMVRAFVREIDMAAKRIVVDVPPGLLDDEGERA